MMAKRGKMIALSCLLCLLMSGCGAEAEDALMVQGNLKTEEINLNSKLPGVISEVLVEEGQAVEVGDVLFRLDSRSLEATKQQADAALQATIGQQRAAESALQAAQAQYEKALHGTRSQELIQAEAAFDLAEKTYTRVKTLQSEGAVSKDDLDKAFLQYTVAQETYAMAREGARGEDVAMAKAAVSQAMAAVEAAKGQVAMAGGSIAEVDSYLEDAEIKAPISGKVTALNVNAGELISTGMPLATISDSKQPWVEVKVWETDLPQISLGQRVEVVIAAYPEQVFIGTVSKINQKPDFATKRSTSNNGDFDVLSYGIKVVFEDLEREVYPGMTVSVNFNNPAKEME